MTAKREAELEAENRVLREHVASLEKIIEQLQYPLTLLHGSYVAPGTAVQPWPNTVWCGDTSVSTGTVTMPGTGFPPPAS
jgi:hypothetical protein